MDVYGITVDSAYWRGYLAYLGGRSKSTNPYANVREEFQHFQAWKDGYNDASWESWR